MRRLLGIVLLLLAAPGARAGELVHLVPALEGNPYRLAAGVRPYRGRLGFSTAAGSLGSQRQYLLRLSYAPRSWLGYEASVAHNPASSVHALFHDFAIVLRRPLPGRLQPYLTAGYGMMIAFPGGALLADSITRNVLSAGGGLELFLREDVALRCDYRGRRLLDSEDGATVAYDYTDFSLGFVFYRSLLP